MLLVSILAVLFGDVIATEVPQEVQCGLRRKHPLQEPKQGERACEQAACGQMCCGREPICRKASVLMLPA